MEMINEIIEFINNNQLNEALDLIAKNEYELNSFPEFWNAKAVLCIKAEEYSTAIECLKKVLELDKSNADAYYNLAYIHEQKGIFSDAAIYYGAATKYATQPELINELKCIYFENSSLQNIKNVAENLEEKTYIILSSCGWGDILQRMHHISRSLVKLGHKVIYVTPPQKNVKANVENISVDIITNYTFNNKRLIEGVEIYDTLNVNVNKNITINNYQNSIQRIIDLEDIQREIVLIAYLPVQVNVIKLLKGNFKVIYECVDDHSDLEYAFWGNKQDIIWEQELMDISDAITTTATSLYLQRRSIEGRNNVYLSKNAVNEGDFISDEKNIPEDLKNIPEPRIIYTGAIYEWFNFDLFYDVVKSNPDKSFVIIGFGKSDLLKEEYPNLFFLGAKKHNELNNYLMHMQVGIIPFKDDTDIIINCDPIKQYEYLACGLPVITTFMPESAINKIYTFCANTKDEFNKAIDTCLNTKIDMDLITNFLIDNSWNDRAALICQIANEDIMDDISSVTVLKLEKELSLLVEKYNHPNYLILYSILLNFKNNELFLNYSKKAFEMLKTKYIERIYVYALFLNSKYDDFINIAKKSKWIEAFFISELLYRRDINDTVAMKATMLFCVKYYYKAKELIFKSKNTQLLKGFYYYFINEFEMALACLKEVPFRDTSDSPLYAYLLTNLKKALGNEKDYEISSKKYFDLERKYLGKVKKNDSLFQIPNINLNKQPFISIIIPTRNSANVLKYALQTCIEQKYNNYEIIVSDNSSPGNEETQKLIVEINCTKIKYYRTPQEFAMIENYEFAYNKASGEYMIIIGSDDGLLLHSLEILPGIINDLNRPLSITWDVLAYGWPDVQINSIKNGLFIPYPTQKNNVKYSYYDETVLKSVLNFETRYSNLPMFYYNSIIKRELAEEAKKVTGNIFYSTPPDVYTGIVFAYLQKKYVHLDMPMSIGGSSGKSMGISGASAIYKDNIFNNDVAFEIGKMHHMNMDYNMYNAPYFTGEDSAVVLAGTLAKKLFFPKSLGLDINRKKFYEVCVKHLFSDSAFEKKKNELYNCILNYGDIKVIKWYEDNYFNNKNFNGYPNYQMNPLTPSYGINGRLILDASKFGVNNVFEAAKLYQNIVGY